MEKAMAPHSSTLAWRIPWMEAPGGLQSMGSLHQTRLSDFTFTFHFHALEKEMATHSSFLAWRIPGTGKPGGLPSMGSRRVGHDWSDLEREDLCIYSGNKLFFWYIFCKDFLLVCCLLIKILNGVSSEQMFLIWMKSKLSFSFYS